MPPAATQSLEQRRCIGKPCRAGFYLIDRGILIIGLRRQHGGKRLASQPVLRLRHVKALRRRILRRLRRLQGERIILQYFERIRDILERGEARSALRSARTGAATMRPRIAKVERKRMDFMMVKSRVNSGGKALAQVVRG